MAKKQRSSVIVMLIGTMLGLAGVACSARPNVAMTVPAGAKPGDLLLEPCTFKSDAGRV